MEHCAARAYPPPIQRHPHDDLPRAAGQPNRRFACQHLCLTPVPCPSGSRRSSRRMPRPRHAFSPRASGRRGRDTRPGPGHAGRGSTDHGYAVDGSGSTEIIEALGLAIDLSQPDPGHLTEQVGAGPGCHGDPPPRGPGPCWCTTRLPYLSRPCAAGGLPWGAREVQLRHASVHLVLVRGRDRCGRAPRTRGGRVRRPRTRCRCSVAQRTAAGEPHLAISSPVIRTTRRFTGPGALCPAVWRRPARPRPRLSGKADRKRGAARDGTGGAGVPARRGVPWCQWFNTSSVLKARSRGATSRPDHRYG